MKVLSLLPLATLSTAFIVPDQQVYVLQHVDIQRHPRPTGSIVERLPSKSDVLNRLEGAVDRISAEVESTFERVSAQLDVLEDGTKRRFDSVLSRVEDISGVVSDGLHESYFDIEAWLESGKEKVDDVKDYFDEPHGPPEHDHPPHDGPPHDGPPHDGPPHHGPPGHHGPPHHKSNLTIYQLISRSNYTTKLAKLIDEFDDIVEALNSTSEGSHFTVFAPTDRAFDKIPEHAPKPSKEQLKALLTYHISPDFYPAGRVLVTRTIPTLLNSSNLGDKPLPQRLSTHISPRGLTVNFYSRIIAVDIFGTNGVIHGVDSIILPPPTGIEIIDLLPSEFSTLELGLAKTGLLDKLNHTDHTGGTFFAPSNFAFQKLGPRINAFLFSKFGLKYLTALLQYHVVANHTLYSDAYYKPSSGESSEIFKMDRPCGKDEKPHGPPKGVFHVDLPTLLDDRSLSVDIFRYGRLIEIKINGFSRVVISDGVAKDGVVHLVSDVLIPPKQLAGARNAVADEEMSLEEFKARLEPLIEGDMLEWQDL